MKGRIKFYRNEKGFGFIKVQDSKDVFFHKSNISRGYEPKEEDSVSFDIENTERGDSGINVTKI